MTFAVDGEKHLIYVPLIPRTGTTALMSIPLAEFSPLIAHSFMRHDDAAFGHHLLDITVAQAEPEVEPDTMTNDLCREALAFVEMGRG